MDFTDEEISQLLGERLHERADLASHARAELAKVQTVSARNYNGEKAALYLARIGALILHIRSQLKHPSEDDDWITGERLRSIFIAACTLKNPDAESYAVEESYLSGLSIAGTNTWLESQRVDEWRPGMRSGSGWVTKYRVTPNGKRHVQRADQSPQELAVASKPTPKAPEPPPWSKPRAHAHAQVTAIAAVKNEVSIVPHIVVNVHVPAAAAAPNPEDERPKKKARNSNGSNTPKEPSPGACLAAAQYQKAMDEHFSRWPGKPPSDDAVHAWLETNLHPDERAKLPKKDAWTRQLRNFRSAAGTQKKRSSPRPPA